MTAKEKVLEHAPRWSEEQAERALQAAEGARSAAQNGASSRDSFMERAAALRARQPEVVDAAALVREARGELEQRAV
jgi:multidrug resistance efflux pump